MKKYIDLEIEVVVFGAEDVITTSGEPEQEPVSDYGIDCYFDPTV